MSIEITTEEFYSILMMNLRYRMGDAGILDIPVWQLKQSNFIVAHRLIHYGSIIGYRFTISEEEESVNKLLKEMNQDG